MSPYRPLPPGVQRFRLDPAAYETVAARALLRRWGLAVAAGVLLLALAARVNSANLEGFEIAGGLALTGTVLVLGWKLATMGAAVTPLLVRYEVLLSERVLRRSTATGPVAEVLRPEVSEILETPAGLWVVCEKPRRSLFVPRALDGYVDVREALSAWAPVQSLRGFASYRRARRERAHQGPRDAVIGTSLASDATLIAELHGARVASIDARTTPAAPSPTPARKALAVWILLVLGFLAVWQVLQPREHRHPMSDQDCQALRPCRAAGLCKSDGFRCIAVTDDDCRQSEFCTKLGRCQAVDGACYDDGHTRAGASSR